MESDQRSKIVDLYPHLELPTIKVLFIPDEYEFMDTDLVEMLQDKINEIINHT